MGDGGYVVVWGGAMSKRRMSQLDLFAFEAPAPPSAPEPQGRPDPLIWVSELHFLRDFDASETALLRKIRLRRGLNVLWAPPAPEGLENRLGDGQITGHTAGKTTFCRMIRYLLGEQRFGTTRAQEKIREAVPNGWIVGEVFVGDERWVVGRPFGVGVHPFAVQRMTIAEALSERGRGGYQEFVAALGRVVIDPVPVKELPHARSPMAWEHVLAWMTRDQEARFAGLVEWRDPSSESESPRVVMDDRHVVLRALCGLMSDEEGEAQRQFEDLTQEKQGLEEAAPRLFDRVAEDRRRLAKLLGLEDSAVDAGPLFTARFRERVTSRRRGIEEIERGLVDAGAAVEHAEEAARCAAEASGACVERLRELEAPRPEKTRGKTREPLLVTVPRGARTNVCGVSSDVARAKGCKLFTAHEKKANEKLEALAIEQASDEVSASEDVAALEAAIVEARSALEQARREQKEAEAAHVLKRSELAGQREKIAAERAAIEELERLYGYMANAEVEAQKNTDRLAKVVELLKASIERQAMLQRQRQDAQGRISDRFQTVVRALLGEHVDAKTLLKNRRIELYVEDRGERDGAAMETIKLLAFDLAALELGMDGHGGSPGMLVHDGPREADMDGRIYERLFLYAKHLEDMAAAGNPASFQYIVTTTAPPPKEMQKAPYLLDPLLDASKPEGRLLGMDL